MKTQLTPENFEKLKDTLKEKLQVSLRSEFPKALGKVFEDSAIYMIRNILCNSKIKYFIDEEESRLNFIIKLKHVKNYPQLISCSMSLQGKAVQEELINGLLQYLNEEEYIVVSPIYYNPSFVEELREKPDYITPTMYYIDIENLISISQSFEETGVSDPQDPNELIILS